jgi:hypothetical protein
MTASRIASRILGIALATTALAFAAAPAGAGESGTWTDLNGNLQISVVNSLPAPPPAPVPYPNLAAPQAGPRAISKSMDMASPKLVQFPALGPPGATLKKTTARRAK